MADSQLPTAITDEEIATLRALLGKMTPLSWAVCPPSERINSRGFVYAENIGAVLEASPLRTSDESLVAKIDNEAQRRRHHGRDDDGGTSLRHGGTTGWVT